MKLKNLLLLTLAAFLFPSLYAQNENPGRHIFNGLKILDWPSPMHSEYDYEGTRESVFDDLVLSAPSKIDSTLAQHLQDFLDAAIIDYDIKGLSAAISAPDGDIWKGASGISFDTVELATDMLFVIGSITKNFMAAIIMQLYEADSLKLTDSIYKWLPPFVNVDSTVTVRQLLNHTSGIYNVTNHPEWWMDSIYIPGSRIWTPEEIIETFVLLPSFTPGTDWEYSNTNYILLGLIIEEITGNEVVTELHNRITIPLGLNSTFLFPDEPFVGVRSHVWFPDGGDTTDVTELVDTTALSAIWTAGGLMSTAEDIVKWSKGLNEGAILNDTTLALMKVPVPFANVNYGLGTQCSPLLYPQWIYGHEGAYGGYNSRLFYVPDDMLSISVISNQNGAPLNDVWLGLYETYMDVINSEIEYQEPVLVQVYPNPVMGFASFSSDEINSYEIYDMTGALIINRISDMVDMSELKPGIYVVFGFDKYSYPLFKGKIIKK